MKILIVCDEGMNRSHTIKGQLQYWGHDCITVGLKRNSISTTTMLAKWANKIILTAKDQRLITEGTHIELDRKTELWDLGPDNYPRPYNTDLLQKVKKLMQDHKDELKPKK